MLQLTGVTEAVYFKDVTWNDEATWVQDISLIVHVLLGWTLKKEGTKNKKNTHAHKGPDQIVSCVEAAVLQPVHLFFVQ